MRAILVLLVLLLTAGQSLAQESEDQKKCREYRSLYDRYAPRGEGAGFDGRLEREIGVDLCRRGQYAEGAAQLLKALKIINIDPR